MEEKKIKGRKRHIVTDTSGNLLHVKVHAANIHDTNAGCEVFKKALEKYSSIQGVSADEGYRKTLKNFVEEELGKRVEISQRIKDGLTVLATRWIVERTFAWFNGFRRLAKDCEIKAVTAENMIMIAHSRLLLKRIA